MWFAAPWWLLGIIPWAGLALWLLIGSGERQRVPFLELWRTNAPAASRRRKIQPPARHVSLVLLAMLVALIAAAGPVVARKPFASLDITLVTDHSMSQAFHNPPNPYLQAEERVHQLLADEFPGSQIHPVAFGESDAGDWNPSTLTDFCRKQLAAASGAALVISDQPIDLSDPRLMQIEPISDLANVGIESLAAKVGLPTQLMVKLLNQSPQNSAEIEVRGDQTLIAQQKISLPANEKSQNYFFDIPGSPKLLSVSIKTDDSLDLADHRGGLLLQSANPNLEIHTQIPEELRRMVDVYRRHRPTNSDSPTVAIKAASEPIDPTYPGIYVAEESFQTTSIAGIEPVTADNSILNLGGIDWPHILSDAQVLPSPPAGNWHPILSATGKTLVAIRTEPTRSVWVGFRSAAFSHEPAFVHFWSEIFDWMDGGQPTYRSEASTFHAGSWTQEQGAAVGMEFKNQILPPGVYRAEDGNRLAISAIAPQLPRPAIEDWESKLRAFANSRRGGTALQAPIILLASGLIALAAICWPRRTTHDPRKNAEVSAIENR